MYVIMPTYKRAIQRSLLVMQIQVLSKASGIHLILSEESPRKTVWIRYLLLRSNMHYSHIACHPLTYVCTTCSKADARPKGLSGRNCALDWLKNNKIMTGIIYFADDDNFYDIKLFNEVRNLFISEM